MTGHDEPDPNRPGAAPAMRADAKRNRERILAAARDVFAEQGIDAPLTDVARRAGVGIATLYRRFPAREELIDAVFVEKMSVYADAVDTALTEPDPWVGFCWYVERICQMQAADHGFTAVVTAMFPGAPALEAQRKRAFRGSAILIARAKKAGKLRPDFSDRDLPMLLMAHAGIIEATGNAVPELGHRFIAYMLEAFRAGQPASPGLPRPPRATELFAVMEAAGACATKPTPR